MMFNKIELRIFIKNTLFYLISYLIFLLTEASPGGWDIVVETLSQESFISILNKKEWNKHVRGQLFKTALGTLPF